MTNQDVIDMVSLGLSDDLIIDKINSVKEPNFDTSISALRVLKAGNVSDNVIRHMINPASSPNSSSAGLTSVVEDRGTSVTEVGVYFIHNGKAAEVSPEIVNWQTGGVLKSHASLGIVKGDVNGKVMRPRSPTQVTVPVEFLIKTPEGTSVEEYQLLRLHEKGNRREFRSVTGGVLHVSGGAERDEIAFQTEKIGNRTWRINLPSLADGEYGFLPPGFESSSISASGKMYTFRVIESSSQSDIRDSARISQSNSKSAPSLSSSNIASPTFGASSDENPTVRHDGVVLSRVILGGPADRAGIKAGDVLLSIDDHYLFTVQEMLDEIARHHAGEQASIRYRRYSTIYQTSLVFESAR